MPSSARAAFIKLNCRHSAGSSGNELFGHEKVFYRCDRAEDGRFEWPIRTLFLDDRRHPAALQPKLLRVLQEQDSSV